MKFFGKTCVSGANTTYVFGDVPLKIKNIATKVILVAS
jgi:hypothetical protein